jgi:hypothetical protein
MQPLLEATGEYSEEWRGRRGSGEKKNVMMLVVVYAYDL